MNRSLFSGTGMLVRLQWRRDRIRLLIWIGVIAFLIISTAASFDGLYVTSAERQAMADTMRNPAMTVMVGPGFGLDNYTNGAMLAHQMLLFTAVIAGVMSILLGARATRQDEEDGRLELLRALPIGRLAHLSAAIIVLSIAQLLLAGITAGALIALGIESVDATGSLLFSAAIGGAGIFFLAVTAVFAQLVENNRAATGFSFAVLGVAFVVRAVGDVSNDAISWLSPLGWVTSTKAYVTNEWGPLVLLLTASVALIGAAFWLNARRDLGSGLIHARKGRTTASPLLLTPLGLALRLQRTGMIVWAISMLLLGVSYGSVLGDLETFFESSEMMADLFEATAGFTLTEQFLTMIMTIMAMLASVPALLFVLKVKGEENKARTEHVLARAVSRLSFLGSYVLIGLAGSAVMVFLAVAGLWGASVTVMDEPIAFTSMAGWGLAYVPAVWVLVGVAVACFGLLPRLTVLPWVYLAYSFLVVYLGGLLQFPEWLSNLSPFGHVPQLPVEEMNWLRLGGLTAVACLLLVAGFAGYRRRDVVE